MQIKMKRRSTWIFEEHGILLLMQEEIVLGVGLNKESLPVVRHHHGPFCLKAEPQMMSPSFGPTVPIVAKSREMREALHRDTATSRGRDFIGAS